MKNKNTAKSEKNSDKEHKCSHWKWSGAETEQTQPLIKVENDTAKNHRPISQVLFFFFFFLFPHYKNTSLLFYAFFFPSGMLPRGRAVYVSTLLLASPLLLSPLAWAGTFSLLPCVGVPARAHRMTVKMAMIPALIRPEMGTVTNHAMKMLRNRRQSTAFLERSQPTATTEPTWQPTHTRD